MKENGKKKPRGNLYLGLAIHEPKRRDDFWFENVYDACLKLIYRPYFDKNGLLIELMRCECSWMRGGVTRERPCCMNILEEWCFLCVSDIMIIIGVYEKILLYCMVKT